MKAKKKDTKKVQVEDPNMEDGMLEIQIIGVTPLIQNRFGDAKQTQIIQKQKGEVVRSKAPRNPEKEFLEAIHVIGKRPIEVSDLKQTRFGLPVSAFKAAIVEMSLQEGEKKTQMRRRIIFISDWGEYAEIFTPGPPVMRQDYVRLQGTKADLRFRPEFRQWYINLKVEYDPRIVSAKQLVHLFAKAGKYNGVGELRCGGKNSSGTYGAWRVGKVSVREPDLSLVGSS